MLVLLGCLVGLVVALLIAAGWYGTDLLLGSQTITEERLVGLLLICPVICTVGIVGLIVYEETR